MAKRINVRELRDSLGLGRKDFAKECTASPRTIRRWENGEAEPSNMALKRLEELQTKTGPRRREALLT